MKKLFAFFLVFQFCTGILYSQSITRLLAVSQIDDSLRVFDTLNYNQVGSSQMTSTLGTIDGCTGLARRSSTGIYYIILKSASTRYLATINPSTGVIATIGNLNDNFAAITFNANNTLLGVTGTGANVPHTVYRINTANANKTLLQTLSGGFGESICFTPVTNKVYQWTDGGPFTFTRYDTTFTSSSNITPNASSDEVFASAHKIGRKFVIYDLNGDFREVDTTGKNVSVNSFLNAPLKGLALITCSRHITASTSSVCNSGSVSLVAPPSTQSYIWYKNNVVINGASSSTITVLGGGTYKCRITDGCGTDTVATVVITPLNSPTVTITGNSVICQGSGGTTLTGTSGGSSQWYLNGTPISSATSNTYVATTFGHYNMIKINTNGCQDSSATGFNVSVAPSPVVSAIAASPLICESSTTTLNAAGAVSYTWTSIGTGSSIIVSPGTSTTYTVNGSNAAGCTGSATAHVSVTPGPTLTMGSTAATLCAGNSATVSVSGATTYSWNTGATSTMIVVNPAITTTYIVTGIQDNCSKTQSHKQIVDACTALENIATAKGISVFPNPVTLMLNVQVAGIAAEYRFDVVDISGRLICSATQQIDLAGGTVTINAREISPGLYFVKVLNQGKLVSMVRVVKQ